jgi:hypothetical protein
MVRIQLKVPKMKLVVGGLECWLSNRCGILAESEPESRSKLDVYCAESRVSGESGRRCFRDIILIAAKRT